MSEILEQLGTAVIEGNVRVKDDLTEDSLDEGLGPKEILDDGLMVGMDHVGKESRRATCSCPRSCARPER